MKSIRIKLNENIEEWKTEMTVESIENPHHLIDKTENDNLMNIIY